MAENPVSLFRIRGGEQTLATLILIDTEPSLPHPHIFSPDFGFMKLNPTSQEDSGFPAEMSGSCGGVQSSFPV